MRERGEAERRERGNGAPAGPGEVDFSRRPFLVIWETTRACDLACRHCRAEAIPERDPGELTTAEARRLMERVRSLGRPLPLFVLTGGDPLKRPDTVELVAHGASLGLRMGMTPSGTPLMTAQVVGRLKRAGLARLAVSLDGSTPEIHDAFRGVDGSWEHTLRTLRSARELGLSTQVNTTVGRHNLHDFDALCERMTELGIALWSVFFLVPTGRAGARDLADAEAFESVFRRMYDLSRTASFDIKSTAAPQYRRHVLQRQVAERRRGERSRRPEPLTSGPGFSLADGVGRAKGVNDGDGFLFVSHTGEIYPSGFLPLSAGDVREEDVVEVYRNAPLFRALRDRDALKGKCGVCEYRAVCGGSRARAYAVTGDPLEAEPFCAHVPARWRRRVERGEAEPARAYFHRRARPEFRHLFEGPALPVASASGGCDCGGGTGTGGCGSRGPGTAEAGGGASPAVEAARRLDAAERLRGVVDPEVGIGIVDLGLLYGLEVRGGEVAVRMTLTTPGCPLGEVLVGAVRRAVEDLPWAERVRVAVVWDPPWHPGMIRPGALHGPG